MQRQLSLTRLRTWAQRPSSRQILRTRQLHYSIVFVISFRPEHPKPMQLFPFIPRSGQVLFALGLLCSFAGLTAAQHVVQPGAPGQQTKVLPASTRAKLPPTSAKDVEFMQ